MKIGTPGSRWTAGALAATVFATCLAAANPLVKNVFTADPAARVFGDRVYVYCSHDLAGAKYWDMTDWELLSSADMVTWKDHGAVATLKEFSWATKWAWAPDALAANGKYYLFLPVDRTKIGVAVGNSPEGPFKDALGKPLIDNQVIPEAGAEPIDPALFADDNGDTYLYFGCRSPKFAQLDRSLTKLAEPLQSVKLLDPSGKPIADTPAEKNPVLPQGYGEAPYLFKREGKYYFVYSNGWAKESTLVYAIGSSPRGPFTYAGKVMEHVPCVTHHGSVVQFHGKWYIFYHTSELSNGKLYERAVCVDELTFAPDGNIITVVASKDGPHAVAATR